MRYRLTTISIISIVLLALSLFGHGCAASPVVKKTSPHTAFDQLLKSSVQGDRVDYASIAANQSLQVYLKWIAETDLKTMPSKQAQLAFYINAYNALTISSVLAFWPKINSVSDIIPNFGFFKTAQHTVAGQRVTLDDIENRIIRPRFQDPRIHAALNCASQACPPLAPFAFTAADLSTQLDNVLRACAHDNSRNHIDGTAGTVKLSKIFDWYKVDFEPAGGAALYLTQFITDPAKQAVLKTAKDVQYLPYDWALNKL